MKQPLTVGLSKGMILRTYGNHSSGSRNLSTWLGGPLLEAGPSSCTIAYTDNMIRPLLVMGLLGGGVAQAADDMLRIEWRWVESSIPGAALSGLRDGATVWGTAGSVSPKTGGTSVSTRTPQDNVGPVQELRVLNGHEASQQFETPTLVQWVEGDRQHARLKGRPGTRANGFAVTPQWPGGSAAVKLSIKLQDAGGELTTTVSQAMGEWHTVLRSGGQAKATERGSVSTREAEGVSNRELQLRVSLEP